MSASELQRPRLYHIKKVSLEQGYGFNIKKEANDYYPIIENVEFNSPAEQAGLKHGDILIEVNYYNVGAESYKDVMKIVRYGLEIDDDKVIENEVILFVVDQITFDYYKSSDTKINSSIENVEILSN
jgi:hypothetical protein